MKSRRVIQFAVLPILVALCLGHRADSQLSRFTFEEPQSRLASGGAFSVRWNDEFHNGLDDGQVYSITWYYATTRDGADRERVTTLLREDFSGPLRGNWRVEGPQGADWVTREDRRGPGNYVSAPRDADAFSREPLGANVVLSVLARPQGISARFRMGLRVQPDGRRYDLLITPDAALLSPPGQRAQEVGRLILPRGWYWYELGLKSNFRRDVEARLRVYDERRAQVLLDVPRLCHKLVTPTGSLPGFIALTGPADFARVYVDPWQARWIDDTKNEFLWNTSKVPDGDYFLIADIHNSKGRWRTEVSPYTVQVRNESRAEGG